MAALNDEPAVLTERRDGVLLITLNRPDARNAVNAEVAEGIAAALDELDADDALTVGVLTGARQGLLLRHGPQGLRRRRKPLRRGPRLRRDHAARRGQAADRGDRGLRRGRRVRGRAVVRPDRRRARAPGSASPRSSAPSSPPAARCSACPQRIPYHLAMELALTGDPIDAERGYELGIVNRLAEPGGAVDAALELAGEIARNGPLALKASKRIVLSRPTGRRPRRGRSRGRSPGR